MSFLMLQFEKSALLQPRSVVVMGLPVTLRMQRNARGKFVDASDFASPGKARCFAVIRAI